MLDKIRNEEAGRGINGEFKSSQLYLPIPASPFLRFRDLFMESRPTIAEIDLAALRNNFFQIKNTIPKGCDILAVVKADAYGHGFMDIAAELESLGVNAFGVAFLAEGIQLRKSGIDRPVLVLGGLYPGQEKEVHRFQHLNHGLFSGTGEAFELCRRQALPESQSPCEDRYRHGPTGDSIHRFSHVF